MELALAGREQERLAYIKSGRSRKSQGVLEEWERQEKGDGGGEEFKEHFEQRWMKIAKQYNATSLLR